ncbi:ATP-dependent nuclease [Burkholderia gladioli]|uniref:ATP-dependent nuclease n=1 Tax=Burkholderia gladioli TaxID=28095 RepID=UPI001641D22A|nr:AAA family ATPase [Burkholderia gladioli]
MLSYQFTIKNYRCFSDENPARFSISRGMVCFLGVNNSGKSALLKMFQELRPLWTILSGMSGNLDPKAMILQSHHVFDQMEVFFDGNNRSIEIEIELIGLADRSENNVLNAKKISLQGSRNEVANAISWRLNLFANNSKIPPQPWRPLLAGDASEFVADGAPPFNIEQIKILALNLSQSLYIGPFRNAITVGSGAHFDLAVGESFINTWHEWQNGSIKKYNTAITTVTENIRRVMGFRSLSITASTQTKTLQLNINGRPFKLNEVGSGLAQLIVVFGNALIRKPSIIFIDEPELNLHPKLQQEFLTSLASYTSFGVVFATHSIGLARSSAERIYTVSSNNNISTVSPYEKSANLIEMLGELSFSSFRDLGAEKLLLVEGTTDVKFFQQLLRMIKKDQRIVVFPLGGNSLAKGGVEHELAELRRIINNIAAIVDSERNSAESEPAKERKEFAETCKRLGFDVLVTQLRATENYFDDEALKAALGPSFSALAPYEKLSGSSNGWAKADNWRVATALNWESFRKTDLGQFIEAL